MEERDVSKAAYDCSENDLSFNTQHGSRHLGGFIREKSLENEWIVSKVSDWAEVVSLVVTMATFVPQSSCAGF